MKTQRAPGTDSAYDVVNFSRPAFEFLGREAGFTNSFTITSTAGSRTTGAIGGGNTGASTVFGGGFAPAALPGGALALDPGLLDFVFNVITTGQSVANGAND